MCCRAHRVEWREFRQSRPLCARSLGHVLDAAATEPVAGRVRRDSRLVQRSSELRFEYFSTSVLPLLLLRTRFSCTWCTSCTTHFAGRRSHSLSTPLSICISSDPSKNLPTSFFSSYMFSKCQSFYFLILIWYFILSCQNYRIPFSDRLLNSWQNHVVNFKIFGFFVSVKKLD